MSVEYYSKLERGAFAGVSASVLDAIARALQLDDAERTHLFDLAHAADGTSAILRPRRRYDDAVEPRPSLQWALDAITNGPAIVRNGRMDLLATNHLGRAMHSASTTVTPTGAAELRPIHLPGPGDSHVSIPTGTSPPTSASPSCVPKPAGTLKTGPSRPRRRTLHPQRGLPSALGPHNVRLHGAGTKRFHHHGRRRADPRVRRTRDMASEPGLDLTLYSAEPGSPTAHALALLASWAATQTRRPERSVTATGC